VFAAGREDRVVQGDDQRRLWRGAELFGQPGGLLVVDAPALGHVGVEADDRRERRS
jgi:hypothetical protein